MNFEQRARELLAAEVAAMPKTWELCDYAEEYEKAALRAIARALEQREPGLCGCGKPAEYMANGGGWCCNKYGIKCRPEQPRDNGPCHQCGDAGVVDYDAEGFAVGMVPCPQCKPQQPEGRGAVAWMTNSPLAINGFTKDKSLANEWEKEGWTVSPLYTTPPAEQPEAQAELHRRVAAVEALSAAGWRWNGTFWDFPPHQAEARVGGDGGSCNHDFDWDSSANGQGYVCSNCGEYIKDCDPDSDWSRPPAQQPAHGVPEVAAVLSRVARELTPLATKASVQTRLDRAERLARELYGAAAMLAAAPAPKPSPTSPDGRAAMVSNHVSRLRGMRLIVQRKIAESTHRVRTNGDADAVKSLKADEAALAAAIKYLEKSNGE